MRTFRCIYVNCFNRLRFLAEVSTRTITQEENIETRQMTIFSSTFYALTTATFIFAFDNSQNSISYGSTFCPFWSVKYLNFGKQLQIWTAHHTFLEGKHPGVTKNPYFIYFSCFLYYLYFPYKSMFCSLRGARKRYQLMDYITSKGEITSKHLIKCIMLCERQLGLQLMCQTLQRKSRTQRQRKLKIFEEYTT